MKRSRGSTPPSHEPYPCIDCGYDLHGLSRDRACPECGTLILRSAWEYAAASGEIRLDLSSLSDDENQRLAAAAEFAGSTPDAAYIVLMTLNDLTQATEPSVPNPEPRHVDARTLCHSIYAHFHSIAPDIGYDGCRITGLDRPLRVGLLVQAFVRLGFLTTQPEDRPDDFRDVLGAAPWFENRRRRDVLEKWNQRPGCFWVRWWLLGLWRFIDVDYPPQVRRWVREDWLLLQDES